MTNPFSGTPTSPEISSPSTPTLGANTFSSLKSMFKPAYQKKCKICGQMFSPNSSPKLPGETNPKQKQAVAIAEAHKSKF